MVTRSTPGAGIPVYQISGANTTRSLPDWLVRKRKQSLKNDPEFQNRVELIQGFEFQEASNRVQVTRDGNYAMATGTYKPQIHVYEFDQMSLKFERHTDAENVDFVILSDDWTKSVHLQNDRTIEFHAQGGIHTRSRIPKFGRAIAYNRANCDIYVAASGNELYRLNVDQGRFLAPFATDAAALNCVEVNPAHGLIGCGTENGTVEFWDPRSRNRVGILGVGGEGHGIGSGVTALSYKSDGLSLAAGTFEGETLLYDLRMSDPLLRKDQGYGLPIKRIGYLDTQSVQDKIWSADKRIVKLWDASNGQAFTSLEPTVDINDVAHIPDTGMFFMANEGIPMHTYYVPAVGPAPRWCSFLDSITEELEEKPTSSVYENYKFVTKQELEKLGLGHLIGSNVVKTYMHGYFLDQRLYEQARLISNPFEYREHRDREIRKRIDKERESRIRTSASEAAKLARESVKVNRDFAAENKDKVDDRFKAMFEDPEFEIDENSFEYKLLHGGRAGASAPSTSASTATVSERNGPRQLTAVEEEEEDKKAAGQSSDESNSDSDDDENDERKRLRKEKQAKRRARQKLQRQREKENAAHDPEMVATQLNANADLTLGEQMARAAARTSSRPAKVAKRGGDLELTFVPKARKPQRRPQSNTDSGRTKSRGDGSLRKASKNEFRRDNVPF